MALKPNKKTQAASNAKSEKVKKPKVQQTHSGGKGTLWSRINPVTSVGSKLFLFFFLSICLIVSIVGWQSYTTSKDIITKEVSKSSHQTIIQVREKLGMVYDSFEATTLQFILDDAYSERVSDLVDVLGDQGANQYEKLQVTKTLEETMLNIILADSRIDSLSFISTDGTLLVSTDTLNVKKGLAEEDWFQKATELDGRPYWAGTRKGGFISEQGIDTFALTRLVKNKMSGETYGVILMELKLSVIGDQLNNIQLGETGSKYVIDENHQIVFAANPDLIAQSTDLLKNVKKTDRLSDTETVTREDGEELLLVYDQSPSNNWTVASTIAISELTESTSEIANITTIMLLVSIVLALLVGFIMVKLVAAPLSNLRNLMNEGERGNLAVRTKVKTKDEIGQVGESFNRMMEEITKLVVATNQSASDVLDTAVHLSTVSKNTAISAKEITLATEQIAEGASTLAVEAERGNEITNHFSQQMNKVVDSNQELGVSAQQIQRAGEKGSHHMAELITKTNTTEEMTRAMVARVDRLKENTSSIQKVLDVLHNMTKQTNILSLNATIEASRAGAAGKGFMVVADEIRNLADQSRQNIDVVGQITLSILTEMEETASALAEAYPLYQEQLASVKDASDIFTNVQSEMQSFVESLDETTQSIEQLNRSQQTLSEAMSSVSAVSEESSATSEEVASLSGQQQSASEGLVELAEKLEGLSKSLQESLNRFKTE
ncbi:methyl-accepting chemotaxis protein [Marinicrinis sediminis]|uniref:Methyl-accepting chemotaxis protein n=1 Tax=Marinicrinis sediminis TaxID=1652465 RepID=A0ABW5R6L7_9BACL